MKKVLVLGGRGFIGRHAVRALLGAGCSVVVGSRQVACTLELAGDSMQPAIELRLEQMGQPSDWASVLHGIDVVINCVGILRERQGESWLAVHRDAPVALYQACCGAGVGHLIHVSALGLSAGAKSGFISSKLQGEIGLLRLATRHALPACSVVRPSLLEGEDGFGSRWLRFMAALPVLAMPAALSGKMAVLDVDDLATALTALALRPASGFSDHELGGLERRTMAEHIGALRHARGAKPALVLPLPYWLARGLAWACDLLHFSPLSRGHLELMCHDNLPRGQELAELLGHDPRPIGCDRPAGSARAIPIGARV